MKKLYVQLTIAFTLVVMVALLITGIIVNQHVYKNFRHFIARYPREMIVNALSNYYATNGAWDGVENIFARIENAEEALSVRDEEVQRGRPANGKARPLTPGWEEEAKRKWEEEVQKQFPPSYEQWDEEEKRAWEEEAKRKWLEETKRKWKENPPPPYEQNLSPPHEKGNPPPKAHEDEDVDLSFILIDDNKNVIYSSSGNEPVNTPLKTEIDEKTDLVQDIVWQRKAVGYLITQNAYTTDLTPEAKNFLAEFHTILIQAGLIAVVLGILIGYIIARGISAPLARLASAARTLSHDLSRRATEEGAEEVSNVARAFNDMAHDLQQSRENYKNMVADVAHELRTPLTVMRGNLQAILEDVYPMEKSEIAAIYDETLILNRLVNDLHELAKADAGQLHLNIQPVDIASVVERDASLFTDMASEKQIALHVRIPDKPCEVSADPARVQQVLHNLLSNALRHTPEGGSIDVFVDRVEEQEKRWVKVSVVDSGTGIPEEHLPHVFERFWRADYSRSRDQGGAGLGLAISRQLIEAHQGTIGVISNLGQGSHFWFQLPLTTSLP